MVVLSVSEQTPPVDPRATRRSGKFAAFERFLVLGKKVAGATFFHAAEPPEGEGHGGRKGMSPLAYLCYPP